MVRDDDGYDEEDEELEALEDDEGEDDDLPEDGEEPEPEPEDDGDLAGADSGKLQELLGRIENNQNARLRLVERELRESAQQRQRIERLLAERSAPAPVPEEEIPDPEVDLGGYLVKSIELLNKKADGFETRAKEAASRSKEDQELLAQYDRAEQQIAEFREETPDYGEVVLGTASALIGALVESGHTQEEASDLVASRIMELRLEAVQKGLNPGAYLYANALSARKAPALAGRVPARKTSAAARQERPPDPVKERVRRDRDRQRGSRSIATLGGRGPRGGDIGKVDLNTLNQESYDRIAENLSGGRRQDEATVLRDLLRSKAKSFTPSKHRR